MKKAYILHHLGLGDHILCNSIYRHYAKEYDMLVLPVKKRNHQSCSDMLADVNNVHVIPLDNNNADSLMTEASYQYQILGFDVIGLGFYGQDFLQHNIHYDENYYLQAGIDFEKRWSDFAFPRNLEVEKSLFKKVCGPSAKEGEYIFLHEDRSRGFTINRDLINEKYNIITPGVRKQHMLGTHDPGHFFDYGYIIENAAAIHCIESSFTALIESMNLNPSIKKYAHRYARPEASSDPRFEFSYRTEWNIIVNAA